MDGIAVSRQVPSLDALFRNTANGVWEADVAILNGTLLWMGVDPNSKICVIRDTDVLTCRDPSTGG